MSEEEFVIKFYSCDNEEQFLKDIYHNFNCLKKENQDTYKDVRIEIKEYKTQQKEFIEWLEAMSKMYENEYKDIDIAGHYNCVLAKYKEIIGVSDDNKTTI